MEGASSRKLMRKQHLTTLCVISYFLILVFTSVSCSISRIASDMTAGIFKEGAPVFEQEGDVETAEISGLAMIKTLEVFNFQNPTNKVYLNLLARSYATYAFGFFETRMVQYQFTDPEKYQMYFDRAKGFYRKGKVFAMEFFQHKDPSLIGAIRKGLDPVRKRVSGYDRHDVEPLFWLAFNWGSFINLSKDDIAVVADLVLVEAMMAQIVKVYPGFFYGGPNMFYGVYYASRPAMLGGNPVQAKEHFEAASQTTGGKNLMVFALEAQFLAVQTMNRDLFNEMIQKVTDGSVEGLPQQRLANALAKQRVKYLQANASHYFN